MTSLQLIYCQVTLTTPHQSFRANAWGKSTEAMRGCYPGAKNTGPGKHDVACHPSAHSPLIADTAYVWTNPKWSFGGHRGRWIFAFYCALLSPCGKEPCDKWRWLWKRNTTCFSGAQLFERLWIPVVMTMIIARWSSISVLELGNVKVCII